MAEPSPPFQERAAKRARVEAILGARRLEAILITDPGTVSWYLCGARSHVVSLADVGIAAVLAGRDREEVRTSVIEAPRLAQEELGEGAPPIVAVPWWIPLDADLGVGRDALGSDGPVEGAADVAADLLVVCARRHGLVCSVTRMRAFAPLDAAARARYRALLDVEAAGVAATRPGEPVGAAVAAMADAYPASGFAADEWHHHHQGGPTGYATRDVLATPATPEPVRSGQAFAWNPSGGGFKVEDTVLATEDGVEILSPDPEWPAVDVAGRERPDVLM